MRSREQGEGGIICDFWSEMDTRHILRDIVFFNRRDGGKRGHMGVRDKQRGVKERRNGGGDVRLVRSLDS